MTEKELKKAMDMYLRTRRLTRVRVNAAGQQAFSDVGGEFYITGWITKCYIGADKCIHEATIASISRGSPIYHKDINAIYLEEVR